MHRRRPMTPTGGSGGSDHPGAHPFVTYYSLPEYATLGQMHAPLYHSFAPPIGMPSPTHPVEVQMHQLMGALASTATTLSTIATALARIEQSVLATTHNVESLRRDVNALAQRLDRKAHTDDRAAVCTVEPSAKNPL